MSSKCLICYSNSDYQRLSNKCGGYGEKVRIANSILFKHLDVIFILRNIFQVPVTQLCDYLKNCPKVDEWICICEKCNELVRSYRAIYNDLMDISRKVEEAKGGIIGIVKNSYDKTNSEIRNDPVFLNITDECRRFINEYEYQGPINPFIDGDKKAQQLWNKENSAPVNNSDKPVSFPRNSRSRSKTTSDIPSDEAINSTTNSYPDDDESFQTNDVDFYSGDNDEESALSTPKPSKKRNQKKTTSKKEWQCPKCPLKYTARSKLLAHHEDKHPDATPLPKLRGGRQRKYPPEYYTVSDTRKRRVRSRVPGKCTHCGKQFGDQHTLRCHIKFRHLLQFRYHCSTCGVGQYSKKLLESHEALCSSEGPKEKCPEEGCPVSVPLKLGLESHFRHKHPDRSYFSKCPICEAGYYTELEFHRHLSRKHKGAKPFICDLCGLGFQAIQRLKNHKIMSHGEEGEGAKKEICDHCGARFASENSLRNHVKTQHEDEFKLRCDQCGKGYMKDNFLKVHLFKKHGIGRVEDFKHRCQVEGCGKVFWTKDTLESHMSLRHESGKVPEFTCEECGKQFYIKWALTLHKKLMHKDKLKMEKFKCEVCGAEFGLIDYLVRHKRTVHKIFPEKRRQDL